MSLCGERLPGYREFVGFGGGVVVVPRAWVCFGVRVAGVCFGLCCLTWGLVWFCLGCVWRGWCGCSGCVYRCPVGCVVSSLR